MIFIGYKKCGTCNKAEKLLKEKGIKYTYREIDKEKPTEKELRSWAEKSGIEMKGMFNTSGRIYKEMGLKDRLKEMSDDEKFRLLASDGMVVKRPVILVGDNVYIGRDAVRYIDEA